MEIFGINCCVVQKIPENLTESDEFSNFAGLLLWFYGKILFNISLNFGWIFFQTVLVDWFYNERIIETRTCSIKQI